MRVSFTKMQGAGNDFVVIDATRSAFALDAAQLRHLGDRRFGVGADQILVVERSATPGVDFRYRIFNGASGQEVEHCGNGARCFVRYVHDKGLSPKRSLVVETVNKHLTLHLSPEGRVRVDMGEPRLGLDDIPFDAQGLQARRQDAAELWPLQWQDGSDTRQAEVAVLSMGNPHAVITVADTETAPVSQWGPAIETHPRFPRRVNVGFMQVLSPSAVSLRVFERDAGETLACGTGACAAVVAGILQGLLDETVDVHTRGGVLTIHWPGRRLGLHSPVEMTGPAQAVFEGEIEL
jgi:diaminopimelate epimerase